MPLSLPQLLCKSTSSNFTTSVGLFENRCRCGTDVVCLNTGPSSSVLWLIKGMWIGWHWWRILPSRWKKLSSTYTMERPCINILVSSLLGDFCIITIYTMMLHGIFRVTHFTRVASLLVYKVRFLDFDSNWVLLFKSRVFKELYSDMTNIHLHLVSLALYEDFDTVECFYDSAARKACCWWPGQ